MNSLSKAEVLEKLEYFLTYSMQADRRMYNVDFYICCNRCCALFSGKLDFEDCYDICYLYESEIMSGVLNRYE